MPPFARRVPVATTEVQATPILPAAAAATRPVGAAAGERSVVAIERSIVDALNESRDMGQRIDRRTDRFWGEIRKFDGNSPDF